MKKQRFTEEQIIAVLKEQEAGAKAADLCRRQGISEATFYNWKAKYGGMEVSEAKRLKALEDECRMVAQNTQSGSPRKRRLWPWLLSVVLVGLLIAGVFAYLEITAMIEDLGRLWDDLVQLFWLIIPQGKK